ncbi:MAG TPA: winged helix-turn-helix domain-containing protein [Terriglobales bacterium]|jgi:DNA-binding winged helix-turn-helix (wHTH) protein
MSTPPAGRAARLLRFGAFEADLTAGELRKNGARLRLQEQPFQLLALLLQRPGEVVTREEVRQRLWSSDTFVDFDHSLNTAVNKIREALGDSASHPRFLETVARRGYRFLAPVESVGDQKNTEAAPAVALHAELEVPLPNRGVTRSLFALIQVMYLVFYLAALFHLRGIDRATEGFLPAWGSITIFVAVLITAGAGIPLRCYLLSAVIFDHRLLGHNFRRMFVYILLLDELWAIAPMLLLGEIGFGAAFAATAGLLYVPFSERTLVRLAYSSVAVSPL